MGVERRDIASEEVALANIRQATTVSLLRVKAQTVATHHRRACRCLVGAGPTPFSFVASEVEGLVALHLREKRLLDFIESNEKGAESILRRIRADESASARLRKANKVGGKLRKDMAKRDAAIEEELNRRLGDGSLCSAMELQVSAVATGSRAGSSVAGAAAAGGADESAPPVARADIMPASYADEIRRMHRKLGAEEAGIRKSTQAEREAAARAAAFDREDLTLVQAYYDMTSRRQAAKRRARQRKKARNAETRAYAAELFSRDPCSDRGVGSV